jgi:hypothetical protein
LATSEEKEQEGDFEVPPSPEPERRSNTVIKFYRDVSAQWKRYDPKVDNGQFSDGQEEASSGAGAFHSQEEITHLREDDID